MLWLPMSLVHIVSQLAQTLKGREIHDSLAQAFILIFEYMFGNNRYYIFVPVVCRDLNWNLN